MCSDRFELINTPSGPAVLDALRTGLALFDRERPGETPGRVVVVARNNPGVIAQAVAVHFPVSQVQLLAPKPLDERARRRVPPAVVIDICTSVDELALSIVGHPAPQLLIDAIPGAGAGKVRRFRELSFALADGGAYLAIDGAGADQGEDSLASELTRLMSLSGRATTTDEWFDLRRRDIIASVSSDGPAVLVSKSGRHYLSLREELTTPVLRRSYGTSWGAELMVRPPEKFRSKAKVTANVQAPSEQFPDELHVPALYLREYVEVVCAPRQLVVRGRFVLPATFHHPSVPRPQNMSFPGSSKYFIEIDADRGEVPLLAGTYFHLDSEYPGHFGHVFTEDIAKLWGWDIAKRRHPELRLLLSSHEESACRPAPFEVEALGAYGIPESDIVCIDHPVRVQCLVTASPQYHNGSVVYVSVRLSDTWARLRQGLRSGTGKRLERIFVARPGVQRSCVNGSRLEATFARHGFDIVRPELLPLAEQAELFATAPVIAGYAGSGMFNMFYSERPGTRIVIASESYGARNEYLISAVKGDDFHYFSCPSRPPADPLSEIAPMHHDFEFDFDRDGDALEELLAST